MDLTEKVLMFQKGQWDWNDIWANLESLVHVYIANALPDESQRSDMIDAMGGRLRRMASRFEYKGKSFEALVYTSVQFQVRTFKKQQARHVELNRRYGAWSIQQESERRSHGTFKETKIPDAVPEFMHPDALDFEALPVDTRRILLVAFRNAHVLDDSHLLILSRRFKLSFDWLFCIREEMKDQTFDKTNQARHLQCSIEALQVAERSTPDSDNACESLNRSITRRGTVDKLRKKLSTIHPYPQHKAISECLGIPSGTVSSALSLFRKQKDKTD